MTKETPLIEIKNLKKSFQKKKLQAVDNVNISIYHNEILGLVGESGCGKSTLAKLLMQLCLQDEGEVLFEGKKRKKPELSTFIQMVFQDPYSSFNPKMTIYEILAEPLLLHKFPKKDLSKEIFHLIGLVGLPKSLASLNPTQLSGGQLQRIAIARAISLKPKCIIFDEAISALDVSVQAQIIHLLLSLQKQLKLTFIFIAHDLAVVKYLSDRIAVMSQGKIVEVNTTHALFTSPQHPFSQKLLSSIIELKK
jgi:ABC-type oligopeptide transport system ATPase subunit